MQTFYLSNLRAIAEPFIIPTTWLKSFFASLKITQIVVFKRFMNSGGG